MGYEGIEETEERKHGLLERYYVRNRNLIFRIAFWSLGHSCLMVSVKKNLSQSDLAQIEETNEETGLKKISRNR